MFDSLADVLSKIRKQSRSCNSDIVKIKTREPRIIDFAAGGERYLVGEIISILSSPYLTVSHTLIRFHRIYSMEEAVTYLVISALAISI